ncbi:hypothetical protein Celaphus_00006319 [Cervus elaphus hippelaphus]|uniref:Ferritin light chain n=1 Tax=Cervus elaphus hippelaphus TaxID=46360 RepID=A0A212CTK7_CEREH|nr:hypothetical protein Celaphus_00006319 [Cervus elaphus hippelaphus]
MSSQICQNYSTAMKATVNCLVNMHLWASYTYLSPGFCFDQEDDGVEATFSWRRTSTRPLRSAWLGVHPHKPHLSDFRESHFQEQVKLTKMGGHLMSLRRLAGPQAVLGEYLRKTHLQALPGASGTQ